MEVIGDVDKSSFGEAVVTKLHSTGLKEKNSLESDLWKNTTVDLEGEMPGITRKYLQFQEVAGSVQESETQHLQASKRIVTLRIWSASSLVSVP